MARIYARHGGILQPYFNAPPLPGRPALPQVRPRFVQTFGWRRSFAKSALWGLYIRSFEY